MTLLEALRLTLWTTHPGVVFAVAFVLGHAAGFVTRHAIKGMNRTTPPFHQSARASEILRRAVGPGSNTGQKSPGAEQA